MFSSLKQMLKRYVDKHNLSRYAESAKKDPHAALCDALRYRDKDFFEYLVSTVGERLDVNRIDQRTERRPIEIACLIGSATDVATLMRLGADVTLEPYYQSNALLKLVAQNLERNKEEVWNLLLPHLDINLADRDGKTVLCTAAMTGHGLDLEFLLKNGADPIANMDSSYSVAHPMLFALMCNENRHPFELLIAAARNVDPADLINQVFVDVCRYPLHGGEYPAEKRIKDLAYLAGLGADCYYSDSRIQGSRPFEVLEASEFSSMFEDTLSFFCEQGLDINGPHSEPGLFIQSILSGAFHPQEKFVALLKNYGADFNQIVNGLHNSEPLWFNILSSGYYYSSTWGPLAKALIEAGANINSVDSNGKYFSERLLGQADINLEKLNTLIGLGLKEVAVERYFSSRDGL